jgi:hypothetical protein
LFSFFVAHQLEQKHPSHSQSNTTLSTYQQPIIVAVEETEIWNVAVFDACVLGCFLGLGLEVVAG